MPEAAAAVLMAAPALLAAAAEVRWYWRAVVSSVALLSLHVRPPHSPPFGLLLRSSFKLLPLLRSSFSSSFKLRMSPGGEARGANRGETGDWRRPSPRHFGTRSLPACIGDERPLEVLEHDKAIS